MAASIVSSVFTNVAFTTTAGNYSANTSTSSSGKAHQLGGSRNQDGGAGIAGIVYTILRVQV
jgi:hypothetical protein